MNSPIQLDDDSVGEQSRAGPSRYKEIIAIPSSDPPSEDLPDLYSGVRYDRLPTPEPELEPTPLSSPQRTSARKRAHDVTGHGDEPERPIDPEPKRIRNKGKSKSTDLVEKQLENARKAAEKEYNRRFKEANKVGSPFLSIDAHTPSHRTERELAPYFKIRSVKGNQNLPLTQFTFKPFILSHPPRLERKIRIPLIDRFAPGIRAPGGSPRIDLF
jgi:hypothetical protein